jgi:hypothetical protein
MAPDRAAEATLLDHGCAPDDSCAGAGTCADDAMTTSTGPDMIPRRISTE